MITLKRDMVLDIIKRGKTANDIMCIIDTLIKAQFVKVCV